ncbi:MAG: transcription termination factor NusA [Candidatus Dojkabacteria bacterium]
MSSQTDFLSAINQIAAERNIDPEEVLEAIKTAVKAGFRRDYPEEEGVNIEVEIDPVGGSISVYADKKVVDEVTNPPTQISLEDAQKLESKLKVGDHVQVDITPSGDFGRVAAQAAKQVILQKIRESEKEAIMVEFKDKIGEIDYAVVQRMDGDSVIFEIRRAVAVMPQEERIPVEFYKSGTRMKVLIKDIREGARGKQLIISRTDPEFLKGLFSLEVPEIVSGSVEIKAVAREAGSRSKVAVSSNTEGVDPIGSCVGQKGVRINAIMNELRFGNIEEKIDIILWDENISAFIANALSPAQVISVTLTDEDEKEAKVIVPDDQLSLAIGKEGQNVRLAAKLTGWNIDIEGETIKIDSPDDDKKEVKGKGKEAKVETVLPAGITELGLPKRVETALGKAGIATLDELKEKIEAGEAIKGIGPKSVEEIKAKLK